MAEVACHMANLDRHLARHLGHLFCELLVDWGGSSRNQDETQATPRTYSPTVRFCIQLRKPVKNRKSKPVKTSCTYERTRPLSTDTKFSTTRVELLQLAAVELNFTAVDPCVDLFTEFSLSYKVRSLMPY